MHTASPLLSSGYVPGAALAQSDTPDAVPGSDGSSLLLAGGGVRASEAPPTCLRTEAALLDVPSPAGGSRLYQRGGPPL